MILAIIAQLGIEIAASPLEYGKGGALCVLLWRFEVLVKETRKNGHNVKGLEMAILFDVSTREFCPPAIKDYADKRIADADALKRAERREREGE